MANTVIQIKYSTINNTPASLNVGELAYSFTSNVLYVGNVATNAVAIGGKYFTDIVNAATESNTSSTIVKRDASGNFSAGTITASLSGNASTADKWQTARNIGVTGDATGIVSVDGSANANIPITLTNTGVSAGVYGGASVIPVINVAANGRIISATNSSISIPSSLTFAGDSGTATLDLATDTLTINGRDGITTTVVDGNNTVIVDVDNTVIRTSGNQSINGDFAINGNLVVQGTTITQNVASYEVDDPIIYLAANNYYADIVDIGFAGNYYDGATQRHTGFVRHAADGKMYAFTNYDKEPINNVIDVNDASFRRANLVANLVDGTITNLATDLAVADGGTGASSFTNGQVVIGQGTNALTTLSNVTAVSATVSQANTLNSFTTDTYGRVTAFTQQLIAIAASQITSGTLPIDRGGTNQTSFTTGQQIIFDGTSLASRANTTTTATGGLSAANTITSVTVNSYGELTAYTGAPIAIGASQITSGTLSVARGGTGAATFTTNGVLLGQGTDAFTTASSSTEGHILTINASGVPTFVSLSGGTF